MTDLEKLAQENQQTAIGTLPAGSTVVQLPPFSAYLVLHPSEPPKVITMGGEIVVLKTDK